MVDFIPSVKTRSGAEIKRGTILSLSETTPESLVVKDIIADAGYLEVVVAVNNDDYNRRTIKVEEFDN
jgi:hypothetical protein